MKFVIVLVALISVALAADVETVRSDSDVGVDKFSFGFETSDGTKHDASGVVNNFGSDAESLAVKGSYQFVADDGQTYTVEYVADENGFQPVGAHIPKAEA